MAEICAVLSGGQRSQPQPGIQGNPSVLYDEEQEPAEKDAVDNRGGMQAGQGILHDPADRGDV